MAVNPVDSSGLHVKTRSGVRDVSDVKMTSDPVFQTVTGHLEILLSLIPLAGDGTGRPYRLKCAPFIPYLLSWWKDVQIQMFFKSKFYLNLSTNELLRNRELTPELDMGGYINSIRSNRSHRTRHLYAVDQTREMCGTSSFCTTSIKLASKHLTSLPFQKSALVRCSVEHFVRSEIYNVADTDQFFSLDSVATWTYSALGDKV